jgi:hypothetical protein
MRDIFDLPDNDAQQTIHRGHRQQRERFTQHSGHRVSVKPMPEPR